MELPLLCVNGIQVCYQSLLFASLDYFAVSNNADKCKKSLTKRALSEWLIELQNSSCSFNRNGYNYKSANNGG
jgi:hypothetical protein